MADTGGEPSMEEILSSIKRIIAEDGDTPPRARRGGRAASDEAGDPGAPVAGPEAPGDEDEDAARGVLELREPLPATPPPAAPPPEHAEPIVSSAASEAMRGSLDLLGRATTRPTAGGDGTLEGLVRDMLRPMMRDWLDANLPRLVEAAVAREIARIADGRR